MAGEETAHTPWASLFSVAFDPYSGYVEDKKRAEEIIKAYEIVTLMSSLHRRSFTILYYVRYDTSCTFSTNNT